MCGISGFISKNFLKNDLVKMTDALSHRGPDASGYFFDPLKGTALGHRRLRILDLSDAANQPMTSHCGRYIMVYNGEIYNFKEIAKKLNKTNWKTSSDSEVILEAFVEWGIDFANHLNGMFAIGIFDKKEDKLFLFRDRMGIKPLYYYYDKENFVFASEIKALTVLSINKEIDKKSINAYLHLGYVPSVHSIYKNIKKIRPGSFLQISKFGHKTKLYWDIRKKFEQTTFSNYELSKNRLHELLRDSINKRLMSDVPLGVFLSGGTDSSLIAAIAQDININQINTFSIGFKDAKHNESNYAKLVAKNINSNHYNFILTEHEALENFDDIINHFDEPFADQSMIPTMLVSKMAKKHVSVCLSGDGGDELFMGYGSYKWAKRLRNSIYSKFKTPISIALSLSHINRHKRAGLLFNLPKKNWNSHIFSQEQYYFSEIEIKKLLVEYQDSSLINEINDLNIEDRFLSPAEAQAYFDLSNYLIDNLLVKVDRMSMFSSLEARVPILDHNIVEFALNLNENLKNEDGIEKYVLKQILYDYLPKKIMDRPKWGFSIPLEKWLKNELYFLIDKYLNRQSIENTGIINSIEVNDLIKRFNKGEDYLYNRLWNLIILQKFLTRF